MAFTSPSFVALLLAVVLLSNAFPSPRGRSWVLTAASVAFIASFVEGPLAVAPLGALLLFGYVQIELLRRTRSSAALAFGLFLTLGAFVLLKRYSFLSPALRLPSGYLIVGLSYVLFRLLHLMIDAVQGELPRAIPARSFFNYCVGFLTFTAGPVQLYPDFSEQERREWRLDRTELEAGLSRIVHGFVKVGVTSAILNYFFGAISGKLLQEGSAALLVTATLLASSAALYTAYLYANFAGYMDIVIGVGWLIGLRLPENFDHPFRARHFLELWSRWHITLSSWFKTYLFNPLLKSLARRFSSAAVAPYLAVIAFFVTFLVMGVWHGTTSVFVVYGLLLGAGASVNKLWQVYLSGRLGKRAYKHWCERPAVREISRGATFAYFAMALTCLWVDMSELRRLAHQLGFSGLWLSYLALTLGAAVTFAGYDLLRSKVSAIWSGPRPPTRAAFARDLGLAAQILLVLSVCSFFHKTPEFVYRAF